MIIRRMVIAIILIPTCIRLLNVSDIAQLLVLEHTYVSNLTSWYLPTNLLRPFEKFRGKM